MSFDGTGGRGPSLQDLFGLLRGMGTSGPDPNGDPIVQVQADIARRARLPKVGGLFGGDYARYMADNAPPAPTPAANWARGGAPDPAGEPQPMPLASSAKPPLLDDLVVRATDPPPQIVPLDQDATAGMRPFPAPVAQSPGPLSQAASAGDDRAKQLDALVNYLPRRDVEGRRPHVYLDSRQIPTVGVGHKVRPEDHLSLGDQPGDQRIAEFLRQDAAAALDAARAQAAEAGIADPNFIVPLASVNFQLGTNWRDKFVKSWPLIVQGDYAGASKEIADSTWNNQTPKRVQQFQSALLKLPPRSTGAR